MTKQSSVQQHPIRFLLGCGLAVIIVLALLVLLVYTEATKHTRPHATFVASPSSAVASASVSPIAPFATTSRPSSAPTSASATVAATPTSATVAPLTSATVVPPPTRRQATPPPSTTTVPLADHVTWKPACSATYHICAQFPQVGDQPGPGYRTESFPSATSRNHRLVRLSSQIWIGPNGRFCSSDADQRCEGRNLGDEVYFVQIIRSQYQDPCQALTAINGGVGHHPVCRTDPRTGKLTVNFHDDTYGGSGRTVWHRGQVIYIGSFNNPKTPTHFFQKFADSITYN